MSWSFSVPAVPAAEFSERAREAYYASLPSIRRGNPDGADQAESALRHAVSLVADGVVGRGTVSADCSGHGNAGHEPAKGCVNDQITITVRCADQYVEPKAEAETVDTDGGAASGVTSSGAAEATPVGPARSGAASKRRR